jgi:hypothetical protein
MPENLPPPEDEPEEETEKDDEEGEDDPPPACPAPFDMFRARTESLPGDD